MMLSLLSTTDAAFVAYYLLKEQDWQLAFNPMNRVNIDDNENKKERNQVFMYQVFIENAIKSDELPAKKIPRGKPADKKIFDRLNIPIEAHDGLTQCDYWITLEDFFVFIERAPVISKDYSHGREALARLLCALIDNDALNEKSINKHLAQKIETAEQSLNVQLKLGDNTLKGCCREILDTLSAIKSSNSENN